MLPRQRQVAGNPVVPQRRNQPVILLDWLSAQALSRLTRVVGHNRRHLDRLKLERRLKVGPSVLRAEQTSKRPRTEATAIQGLVGVQA